MNMLISRIYFEKLKEKNFDPALCPCCALQIIFRETDLLIFLRENDCNKFILILVKEIILHNIWLLMNAIEFPYFPQFVNLL